MADRVFAVPVFFICFRESLEASIIVSVLLTVVKQTLGGSDKTVYSKLVKQVWWGVGTAFLICLAVGGGMIGAFYRYGSNHFSLTENIWEGVFGLLASIIISVMGAAMLRVSKLQDKWRVKIARAIEKKDNGAVRASAGSRFKLWCERYAMFILPFITVLREGLEAVIFIGGVGLSLPATSFPLAVFCGFLCGILVGYLIYRGGNTARMQVFLIVSTCFLYLVAAGLFSKAVWYFEADAWAKVIGGDADDVGSGPGSYDIRKSVWHVNCCNAEDKSNGGGGWGIFNALFGWQNSATYGSVISYNLYWLVVIVAFLLMRFQEQRGHLPFMKPRAKSSIDDASDDQSGSDVQITGIEKKAGSEQPATTTGVREVQG